MDDYIYIYIYMKIFVMEIFVMDIYSKIEIYV